MCGCPEGYVARGDKCATPQSCRDGTPPGECSSTKPLLCLNGNLVSRASLCGCTGYSRPAWADTPPAWNITSLLSMGFGNPKWYTDNLTFAISNCSGLQKNSMLQAFQNLLNGTHTSLSFREVRDGCPDITANCVPGGLETGLEEGIAETTVIRRSEGFYTVITRASITLSDEATLCATPAVELHELLHAFGFADTKDPADIMYERLGCQGGLTPGLKSDLSHIYPK
jgi:hypothetical protein